MDDLALIGSAFKFADLPFDEVGRASLVHRFPLLLAPEPWFRLKVGIVLLAMRLDEERSYDKMLTLCTSKKYVKDMWQVLLGYKIKKWNLIQDDAKGVAGARAVGNVVFVF